MTQHNPQQHEPYILETFFTPSPKENAEASTAEAEQTDMSRRHDLGIRALTIITT